MTGALVVLGWTIFVYACYWPAFRFGLPDALSDFRAGGVPWRAADAVSAWGDAARAALTAALVVLAVRAAGRPAARVGGLRGPDWIVAVPLGLGAAGAFVLGLGLAGLLQPALLVALVVALAVAGGVPRGFPLPSAGIPWWAAALCALTALAALPGALVPEVTYDALAYHLGAPDLYLRLHRIVRFDHMMFTDFPLAVQMSYLLGKAAGGGDVAAKLISFSLGLGTMAVAAELGGRLGSRTGAGWAAVGLAASPMIATQMTRANVDLGCSLAAGAACWWLAGRRSRTSAFAAGLLGGCAAAAKLTGGYVLVAGAAVLLLSGRSEDRRRPSRLASLALLSAGAALPLAPWFARTWLMTGNPIYPFGSGLLGGLGWTAANAAAYARDMTEPNSFNIQYSGLLSRLLLPWRMIMHDRGSGAAFAAFPLALLPAYVWLRAPAHRAAARLGMAAAAGWLCWAATARDPRFVLPLWPAICALAGVAAAELAGRAGALARWAVAAGAIVTIPFVASDVGRTLRPGAVLWGAVPREAYAEFLLAPPRVWVPLMRVAGAAARPGVLLVVGDVKAPYSGSRVIYPSMFDTPALEAWVSESASAARLAVKFREHAVTAVFFHEGGAAYLKSRFGPFTWTMRDRAVLRGFWERRLEPVREWHGEGALLGVYRVVAPRQRPRPLPLPGESS